MMSKGLGTRMTWEEIKLNYPHQNVGLVDCLPDPITMDSAIVKYTDKETSYFDLLKMALNGEIALRYTTLDEDCMVI